MELLKCARCGHCWYQRKPGKPRRCAGCKVLYWERPARIPATPREVGAIGRPLLFPELEHIEVGQVVFLPWKTLPNGTPDNKANSKHDRAAHYRARVMGWHIITNGTPRGLRVERLP